MNNMNNNSLPELKIIAEALKSLKEKKIIRTKNLVGDLGEYYCKEYFGLTLEENAVNKGFDAIDKEGKKVEIKTAAHSTHTPPARRYARGGCHRAHPPSAR